MKNLLLAAFLLFAFSFSVKGQTMANMVVRVSATVNPGNGGITFNWIGDAAATSYDVYKKQKTSTSWGFPIAQLADTATTWTDASISPGLSFEYRFVKNGSGFTGYGYCYAGIELPATDYRGKLILVVDTTWWTQIGPKVERLETDIRGDGWEVIRIEVDASDSVPDVKSRIKAEFQADPQNVKTVFLLGRVPVPYSGNLNPDAHPDHQGAWPADAYYAEMDGNWSDASVNNSVASRNENKNIPGDGKFDQTTIPSLVELEVGRVDFFGMSTFAPLTEGDLLERYLDKDHAWRTGVVEVTDSAVIDDNFGYFSGEAFASSGWRNFGPMVGPANTASGDYFTTLKGTNTYRWSYGCGGGSYTSAGGVGNTANFAAPGDTIRSVFTMLFGSYFGDWDANNNFLRASLASAGNILSCSWAGRPHWHYHHMGLGEHIGYSARLTMNNSSLYVYNYAARQVHIALMGDPSVRLHPVRPASNLSLTPVNSNHWIELNWNASPDPVVGYYVYRSADSTGRYDRISSTLIMDSTWTDSCPLNGNAFYMVKPVMLTIAFSGSYYNTGQGIMAGILAPGSLTLDPVNPGPYCAGDSIFVPYVQIGPSCPNTLLYAELSDSNGIFSQADTIGTFLLSGGSPAAYRIPANHPGGNGYRIRLRTDQPDYLSPINTLNLVINPLPNSDFSWSVIGNTVTFTNLTPYANSQVWNFGDGDTSSATSPVHTFASTGPYIVSLISTNGCGNDTMTYSLNLVGTNPDLANVSMQVFPNPAGQSFRIQFNTEIHSANVQMFDLSGREVFSRSFELNAGDLITIPVNELPSGLYQVVVNSEAGKATSAIRVAH